MSRLHTFKGGLHVEGHKTLSTHRPLSHMPIPRQLILPVSQHIGAPAEVLVKVGDKVAKGQMLADADGALSAAVHAPTSGTISAVEERGIPHASGLPGLCIVLDSDGEDAWADGEPQVRDYRDLDAAEIADIARQAGIVGLGGATFPTDIKLRSGEQKRIETLIINGAECEPYITCDDMLMRSRPEEIVQGIQILLKASGAERCLLAIEDNKPEAFDALEKVLKAVKDERIELVCIPTVYPSGGEKQLIRIVTGHEVPSGGIPADLGLLCQNVGTAAALFRAVCCGEPLISRVVTVTGEGVKEPQNVEVLIGTPMADVIAHCGGYHHDIARLIVGGPLMGFTVYKDALPITKAVNCLLTRTAAEVSAEPEENPCIRCGECAKACPAELLPQQLYWYARARDFDKAQEYDLKDCIECGCCSYVCPSHIPLVQYYRFAKTEIRAREREQIKADRARQRHENRLARQEREKAEREERMRKKKAALKKKAPKKDADGDAKADKGADDKQDAIAAAIERAKAKKAAQQTEQQ